MNTDQNNGLSNALSELLETTPENAERIWEEFFPRLIRFAKKKLTDMPTRTFDEEDIALSAMKSFFRGQEAGRFDELTSKDEMWRLLATITARKVIMQRRRMLTEKRGGGEVRGESVFMQVGQSADSTFAGLASFSDENLLPETTEEFLKSCEHLLAKLTDEKLRQTAILRLEGYSNQDISDQMKCSVVRTKQRLQRIRQIWNCEFGAVL